MAINKSLLLYGRSSSGKSSSLESIDQTSLYYINCEKKTISYNHKGLYKESKPMTVSQVQQSIKEAIEDDKVQTVVLDSLTMLVDIMAYKELVKEAADSRGGWMDLRDWVQQMLEYIKGSDKTFIFIALEMALDNKAEFTQNKVPKLSGSMKEMLSSHFTTVLRSTCTVEDGKLLYRFQTNRTADEFDVEAKSPRGMLEPYEPNDMGTILTKMDEYYN